MFQLTSLYFLTTHQMSTYTALKSRHPYLNACMLKRFNFWELRRDSITPTVLDQLKILYLNFRKNLFSNSILQSINIERFFVVAPPPPHPPKKIKSKENNKVSVPYFDIFFLTLNIHHVIKTLKIDLKSFILKWFTERSFRKYYLVSID